MLPFGHQPATVPLACWSQVSELSWQWPLEESYLKPSQVGWEEQAAAQALEEAAERLPCWRPWLARVELGLMKHCLLSEVLRWNY